MRQISSKVTLCVCTAIGLVACAGAPVYPTNVGYVAPPPLAPKYPVRNRPSPPPPQVVAAIVPAEPTIRSNPAPLPAVVQSQSLPPATATAPPVDAAPARSVDALPSAPVYIAPRPRPEPTRFIATGKVVAAPRMFRDYQVRKGDRLQDIAHDLDSTAKDLVDANHLKSADQLRPGQHLKVPIAHAYVVASGDTMAALAKRFDISAGALADINNLSIRDRLRPGDRLALPVNIHDLGPVRVANAAETHGRAPRTAWRRPEEAPPVSSASEGLGGYRPSAEALAEAARRRAEANQPSSTSVYAPAPASPSVPSGLSNADVTAAGLGRFVWPVRGDLITAFGAMGMGRRNDGLDIRATDGTVVRSAAAGEVVYAGDQVPGFGNLVLVKHADGWVTAYAHLQRFSVQMRQSVMQGQAVGLVGSSGGVFESQLHFEIRYAPRPTDKAKPIDPRLVLPQ